MVNYYEENGDFGYYGDPSRCSIHGCVTSSPNGLIDAPCPECEDEDWQRWKNSEFDEWVAEHGIVLEEPAPGVDVLTVDDVLIDDDIIEF